MLAADMAVRMAFNRVAYALHRDVIFIFFDMGNELITTSSMMTSSPFNAMNQFEITC